MFKDFPPLFDPRIIYTNLFRGSSKGHACDWVKPKNLYKHDFSLNFIVLLLDMFDLSIISSTVNLPLPHWEVKSLTPNKDH